MKFRVKDMNIATGGIYIAILNEIDAKALDLRLGDRLLIKSGKKEVTCILDTSHDKKVVPVGKIGLFEETIAKIGDHGKEVEVKPTGKPDSVNFIRNKLYGKRLSYDELYQITDDITNDRLTDIEKTFFVSGSFAHGLNIQEIVDLTRAMVETGKKLKFKGIMVRDFGDFLWGIFLHT